MKRKLSISPYCQNCKKHCLFEFWSDTFPEAGEILVECPNCKQMQFVIQLKMTVQNGKQEGVNKILRHTE